MRFRPLSAAPCPLACALALPLLLAGCARTTDQFKPQVVITSPEGGAVSANKSFVLKGYVMDDRSVASLKVQGQSVPIKAGARIVPFSYQTSIKSSASTYTIEATDMAGNKTVLSLPLRVDNTPPKITVTKFERQGKAIRVTGIVTDNISVAQVAVDGVILNIAPGTSTDFYAETSGTYADIQAKDGAGNVANLRAR